MHIDRRSCLVQFGGIMHDAGVQRTSKTDNNPKRIKRGDRMMSATMRATFGLLAVDCCAVFKVHVTTKAAILLSLTFFDVMRLVLCWVHHPTSDTHTHIHADYGSLCLATAAYVLRSILLSFRDMTIRRTTDGRTTATITYLVLNVGQQWYHYHGAPDYNVSKKNRTATINKT